MKDVHTSRDEYGARVRQLRHDADMSLRAVEKITGSPYSMLAMIERGEKAVGSDVATKLADAFNLTGEIRDRFLMQAAGTRKRDRLVGYARGLAPELVNYVAKALQGCGVVLEQIDSCSLTKASGPIGVHQAQDQLVLGLKDGSQIVCGLTVGAGA